MLFETPIPFEEALDSRKVKALLPTSLSSKELREIAPELRERAMFSARTANAVYLQKIDDVLESLINPKQVVRDEEEPSVTEGFNLATARVELKDALDEISYKPEEGEEGTITDLRSDPRLNLVLQTNANMAAGYGQWAQMQDAEILDEFPAQELYRAEGRKVPREWLERWQESGGELFDGRMIALVNDPIWQELGNYDDGLGNPYPPFAFNSGMDVQPVSRKEAEDLGLIEPNETVAPESRGFDEDLEASPEIRSAKLKAALLDSMPGFKFEGDVLTKANENSDLSNADNCGTGSGGFQPGNSCAKGSSGAKETPLQLSASAQSFKSGSEAPSVLNGVKIKPVESIQYDQVKNYDLKEPALKMPEPKPPHEPSFNGEFAETNRKAIAEIKALSKSGNVQALRDLPIHPSPKVEHYIVDSIKFNQGQLGSTKHVSSGAGIVEPDGRVWLTEPKGQFGGYKYTWPKGTLEEGSGLSLQQNAHKEIHEETGLTVKLTGHLGDYEGDTSINRFYTAVRRGGDPRAFKTDETAAVHLVSFDDAEKMLNRPRDRKILADLKKRWTEKQATNSEDIVGLPDDDVDDLTNEAHQGNSFPTPQAARACQAEPPRGGLTQVLANQQTDPSGSPQEARTLPDTSGHSVQSRRLGLPQTLDNQENGSSQAADTRLPGGPGGRLTQGSENKGTFKPSKASFRARAVNLWLRLTAACRGSNVKQERP